MTGLPFTVKAPLLLISLTLVAVAAIWWARQPGGRALKLFVLGGPIVWLYAAGRPRPNLLVCLLLGGPIVLLIHDLVDDEQAARQTGSSRGR